MQTNSATAEESAAASEEFSSQSALLFGASPDDSLACGKVKNDFSGWIINP